MQEQTNALRNWPRLLLIAALLLYGGLMIYHTSFSVRGYDSTGYANAAYSLRHGTVIEAVPLLKELGLPSTYAPAFLPLTYLSLPDTDKMAPLYPVGLPLHLTFFSQLFGWQTGLYIVSPIFAMLSVWLLYLLGLEIGLQRKDAIAAAFLFACCPPLVFYGLQVMSDVTATFWSLFAILAALRAQKNLRWSLCAGAAFGVMVLVRPGNAVLLLPLMFCLPLNWRSLLYFGLGGLPLGLFFFAYNYLVFGHLFFIGYNAIGLQQNFGFPGFTERFRQYASWLTLAMSPLIWIGWLFIPFQRKLTQRTRFLLISWFGVFFALCCIYMWTGDGWWYTRFLLPAIPALILALIVTGEILLEWLAMRSRSPTAHPQLSSIGLFLLVGAMIGYEVWFLLRPAVLDIDKSISLDRAVCRNAKQMLPENALVVAMDLSGTWKFYANRPSVRYDLISSEQLQEILQRGTLQNRTTYAFLLDYEVERVRKKIPGEWINIYEFDRYSIWRLNPLPK